MKHLQKNLTELHKRLYAVLPQYQPISAYSGRSGTFKAINHEGNVYLVTWQHFEDKPPVRKEEFAMDYFTLCRKSDEKVSTMRPEQGWDLSDFD